MKNHLILLIAATALMACSDAKKTEKNSGAINREVALEEELIGTWSNLTLNVTIRRAAGDSVFRVARGHWEKVLGIKPIVTEINEDGTFTSSYFALTGELMMSKGGAWYVKGDTMVMEQNGESTAYHTVIENGVATFTGYLDWDQDGERDDLYSGTQQKQMESN